MLQERTSEIDINLQVVNNSLSNQTSCVSEMSEMSWN